MLRGGRGQVRNPLYLYDEHRLRKSCLELLAMPSAFGLKVCYAMEACPAAGLLAAEAAPRPDAVMARLPDGRQPPSVRSCEGTTQSAVLLSR